MSATQLACTRLNRNRVCGDPCVHTTDCSDPFVQIKCDGLSKIKTKVQEDTLDPVWNETFAVPCTDK